MSDQPYTEPRVLRDGRPIYVRDYPGPEPALILMHGFPDSLELYNFLIPHLIGKRRVIAFDFIGWGRSDKSPENVYTFENLERDLDCVITQLALETPDLVAHDASGPPAIEWSLKHPDKVGNLILLNTVYMMMLRLRPPEGIFLYMMPLLKYVTRFLNELSGHKLNLYLYDWQIKRFIRDKAVKNTFVPHLYEEWKTSWPAFRDLVGRLFFYSISRARQENLNKLRTYRGRVRIIFGSRDPYLNIHVARKLHQLFSNSDIFLLDKGYHYVQVDEPETVARLILELREPEQSDAQVEAHPPYPVETSVA